MRVAGQINLGVRFVRLLTAASAAWSLPAARPANGAPAVQTDLGNLAGTNASVRQLSPNVYAIGLVRLNKQARTITFPGSVNMTTGLVEYAVVHVTGKVHESVLKTETDPYHIHLANLLLASAQGPGPAAGTNLPPDLTGAPVQLAVRWKLAGAETNAPLEELIINTLTGTRMTRGDWIYNGSRLVEGVFLAQRDGQIAAIIPDQDSLINNPRPGREDDEIWRPNPRLVPPVGTPVEIVLQLPAQRK